MSRDVHQIYIDNPIAAFTNTDLFYAGRSPYGIGNDAAGTYQTLLSNINSGITGNTSITTLGTITVGTWNASVIGAAYGGTGANITPDNGAIVYSNASTLALLAPPSANRSMLQGNISSAPTWSASTWPSTITANEILYGSSSNVVSGLATANNGVLITSAGGVPSIGSTLPTAVQANITQVGTIASGTWQGSVIGLAYGGTNANLTPSNGGIVYSTSSALAILAGSVSANKVLLSGTSSAPSWSSASYPASTTINQLLYSSSNNVISELTAVNRATLVTSAAGVPSLLTLNNGEFIIGSSSGAPLQGTITAGANISITNGANSITVSASGTSAFVWNPVIGTTQAMANNNGYVNFNAALTTFTLPTTAVFGSIIYISSGGAGNFRIAQNAGQNVWLGAISTTVGTGGYIESTNVRDGIQLFCVVANTTWQANVGPQGTFTII